MVFLAIVAFLLGSVPTAVLVGRRVGVDVRGSGSANPGATNTWRVAGRGAGAIVLAVDALKGWLAVTLVPVLQPEPAAWAGPVVAACAVLGHVFNPWLRWTGGKGVATSAGAIGALAPRVLPGPLAVFAIVFALRRRASEASIIAAWSLPVFAVAYRLLPPAGRPASELVALCVALALFLTWTHRENIRRIGAGRESKLPF